MDQIWIDLNSPTKEEVDSIMITQNISPALAKDLLTPTPTQYSEDCGDVIYAVLRIPTFKHTHPNEIGQELDFIISKNSVITARYDSIDALHYFAKKIEVNEILNHQNNLHLFFGMMEEIYNFITNELASIEVWITEIEKNIFEGQEKEMVFAISNTGRNILNFKRAIDPHGEVFDFIARVGGEKFGKSFEDEAKVLRDEWRRVMKRINNYLDMIAELRETNNSMLSTKQNETMKILTIMAFVTFPLSLIASIFGMNTYFTPFVGNPNDFWIVLSIMCVMSIAMFGFFKYKRWI
jgi:magnesium transporter